MKYNSPKIVSREVAAEKVEIFKPHLSVGLCHVDFESLNPEKIRFLQSAKSLCDRLYVSVVPGSRQEEIAYSISALECVYGVLKSDLSSAAELIDYLKPTFYIRDSSPQRIPLIPIEEVVALKSCGGEIRNI